MSCGIYAVRNLRTGRVYIGSSKDIERRWVEHRSSLRREETVPKQLLEDYREFGKSSFVLEILEECSPDRLDQLETRYIHEFFLLSGGVYNIQKLPLEHSAQKPHGNFGRKRSASERETLREGHKSRDPESYRRSGESRRGQTRSQETRNRMSESAKKRWRRLREDKS